MDRAAQLLEAVIQEMQEYAEQRSEDWHSKDLGTTFDQNIQDVIDVQPDLDDLRSNF